MVFLMAAYLGCRYTIRSKSTLRDMSSLSINAFRKALFLA